jgi:chromosomal replication initiation ATPase DnaA
MNQLTPIIKRLRDLKDNQNKIQREIDYLLSELIKIRSSENKKTFHSQLSDNDIKLEIDNLFDIILDYYKIKKTDILSKCSSAKYVFPKMMLVWIIISEFNNLYDPSIIALLLNRDRTTILHYKNNYHLVNSMPKLKQDFINIKNILHNNLQF